MKKYLIYILILSAQLYLSCAKTKTIKELSAETGISNHFVAPEYVDARPLAEILNMSDNETAERSFELAKNTDIHVYATGELIYNLADVPAKYYFKGDDIEMFFRFIDPVTRKDQTRQFIFPFSDTHGAGGGKEVLSLAEGTILKGLVIDKNIAHSQFYAEIKYPWKALGIDHVSGNERCDLEVAIGDCDDRFKQKSKIAWKSIDQDPLYDTPRAYGSLFIVRSLRESPADGNCYSLPRDRKIKFGNRESWTDLPVVKLENKVMGEIRNKYDLSAQMRTCWDKDSLYFSISIVDQRMVKVKRKDILNQRTFADYGWIESEEGKRIWDMNALHSTYAGGALKNHKIDTILHLKAGKYLLKYITDESHSYGNWDSPPPLIPFYGIIIYKK